MANFTVKCTCSPKGAKKAMASAPKAAAGPVSDLLTDLQDQLFTANGVDKQGSPVDISAVATLTCVSDAPAIFSVDPAAGQTVQGHALLAGSANLTFTETWKDGSIGPFTWVQPVTVSGSAAVGFTVTPGTPVTRP
jgi:hypothetical protein